MVNSRKEREQKLINALKEIGQEVQWYRVCCGAVSQDDMRNMLQEVIKTVDSVKEIVYGNGTSRYKDDKPLDDNF